MTGQIVQVRLWGARPYTYVWDGDEPLAIGDRVMVPPPPHARSKVGSVGRVCGFGSNYPGPLAAIVERA